MDEAPLPNILTPKEKITESFVIKQEENNYKLNIEIINQEIMLDILDENDLMKEYDIKLTFEELKSLNKMFLAFNSFQDFIDLIKAAIENKKVLFKKNKESRITIELIVEYLFKKNTIQFELIQKKINFELIAQDLYQKINNMNQSLKNLEINYNNVVEENKSIKEENKKLNDENTKIKKEIKDLEEENKTIKERLSNVENQINLNNKINSISDYSINSTIMEKNEFEFIHKAIKERMNKEIKEVKKIYQATKDGGDFNSFHKLCDDISNTLVLYKSAGNRRFGGFTTQSWRDAKKASYDKYCFLFSLDKNKIYYSKENDFGIFFYSKDGPCFHKNRIHLIHCYGNPLIDKTLKTQEAGFNQIFNGDKNALSEDGNAEGVYAKEYEVFQIIFM